MVLSARKEWRTLRLGENVVEDYVQVKKHNLNETFIYIYSLQPGQPGHHGVNVKVSARKKEAEHALQMAAPVLGRVLKLKIVPEDYVQVRKYSLLSNFPSISSVMH